MKFSSLAVLVSAAVATALSGAPLSHAATSGPISATQLSIAQDESPKRWFVELSGPAVVQGVTPRAVGREQAAFRQAAKAAGISFNEKFQYQTLWNGFSVEASFADAGKLRAVPGVRAVYPVVEFDAPPKPEARTAPDVDASTVLTGVDIARSELGLTGKGVKVAIIDTGIDYDHPDLGGCFGPGCKVAYGYDFVGDNYDASGRFGSPIPVPGPDPDDCNGHGTHVAGIVGANAASANGVTGVAPDVTLGAYRVFGCAGSSSADVIIAALERAYADGMNVINQSLGAAFQWPEYPTGTVGDRLVEQGVVVVASAGNSGATGTFSIGAPGVGKDVIGVASFNNVLATLPAFTVEPDGRGIGYGSATGAPPPPPSGTFPIARTGTTASPADACSPVAEDLDGKIALIRRGTCSFYIKAINAQNAGASGVVLYNSFAGRFGATVAPTTPADPPVAIPVVTITAADGAFIDGNLQTGPVTLDWTVVLVNEPVPGAGLISAFSSWGLSPDLALKPDLGGPGGSIYSTFPVELGSYASLSGTSMSAPHVAGAVAMLLEAKPDTRASDVRDLLQNTAQPRVWSGNPASGFLDAVARQGAGMIDIVAAVKNTVHVSPGKLSLGESEAGPHLVSLTVANNGDEDVTFTLGAQTNAVGVTRAIQFNDLGYIVGGSAVEFDQTSVTVPAGGSAMVSATIFPADLQDYLYGGYITLTSEDTTLRVPYAGFLGDYQLMEPLSENFLGLPWLATLENGRFDNQPEGASFSMEGGDVPYILYNLYHQVRRMEVSIIDAATERPVHPVFSRYFAADYLGRNSNDEAFFGFVFDGTREHSAGNSDLFKILANGDYKVTISVLKALGDASNPDHWETWTSPTITIARPEEPKKKTINLRGRGR